ncbi:transcriptional regulator, AsnC family protein [Pseudooceanicola batsensis HTCC2597]|uniref:Transcriptional regulator, AsnC family protein n=1 Tax=Pseudooceanicola batsensis (strain ATCC BAA-863 / DSM 15984 / KCTC 12145 / HTCC2597) TaxID=252305 RepID=A3TWB0_PSEBH|nr:Lrp/AsnC family transcriptional regulator [Pseudooceanicola batsensis]EAQ03906.1 transcriptional regulator, AsnC family protein [Pseudooceanicola batsensis HTCC2597]
MSGFRLDARDVEILRILEAEGRITKAELATRINLSPTPCWDRLKRLEKAGIIAGYGARVSLRALAPHVVIFVAVELETHKTDQFQTFEDAVQEIPEITACWALGGGFDYLLQVVARDIDAYQRLIDRMLASDIGMARYYTYIVTKPVKAPSPLPYAALDLPPKD